MRLVLALLLSWFARPALASELITFGDSWAEQGADELQAALRANGHPALLVDERALGGTTTAYWVTVQPMELIFAVDDNPDARWIWISLGGNDSTEGRTNGMTPQQIEQQIESNLRVLLDNLFAAHPDVLVVMFGYDYTNWEIQDCPEQRDAIFGAGSNQALVNSAIMTEVGAVEQRVAQDYPNAAYVPIWGAMQRAAGLQPDPTRPSPADLMMDCVHPTSAGYRVVMDALVEAWWNVSQPSAAITADATERCRGNTITFDSSQSTDVEHLRWRVDGVELGRGPTVSVPLSRAGQIEVELTVYNRALSARAIEQVTVDPCLPDGGIADGGEVDAGVLDSGPRDAITPADVGDLRYDGGVRDDAGNLIPEDAGSIAADGGPGWTLGGGCSAAGHPVAGGSGSPLLLAFCLGAICRRCSKRRRRV